MMRGVSTAETLEAKVAYEREAKKYGVKVKHYRGENLRFNDKPFVDSVNECHQELDL